MGRSPGGDFAGERKLYPPGGPYLGSNPFFPALFLLFSPWVMETVTFRHPGVSTREPASCRLTV
ncbi:MAG: hypothetical protein AVDCRST_MAG56-5989 [uncultured Cytophagales bacterium]|uniref:Uncharacterized protein n=1 Tax=uncultured Cytophagales bacterium TaxID=158755 RepID=A0A6J4KLC1_9SPHI|nr:MAG: hypothetical protein AVDCRST_MAG56-5989 [uncultured Cytophagales bacterium]